MEPLEQGFSLREFIKIARRRHLLLSAVGGGTLFLALLFALLLPPTYRSNAVVLIEKQEIPPDLVRSTVTSYADQRIQVISQRVMTSENLTSIIQKYNLYEKKRRREPLETVLEDMRGEISRQMIRADVLDPVLGRAVSATIAFRLSFVNQSPSIAQQVVNEIVSLYLNENLKSRTDAAVQTTSFLIREQAQLTQRVGELETQLATFKEQNINQLPENAIFQRDLLERARTDIAEGDRQKNEASQRKLLLQAQLTAVSPFGEIFNDQGQRVLDGEARSRALKEQLSQAKASYGENYPDVRRLQRELSAASAAGPSAAPSETLRGARAELARLSSKYSSTHPDVVAQQRKVALLEAAARAAPRPQPSNPVYQQIAAQIAVTDAELSSLEGKRQTLAGRLGQLEKSVQDAPKAEQRFQAINRKYENAMTEYREITPKRRLADISKNLEDDRKSEKFTLLEPPTLPEEPFKPNRLLIVVLGILGAIVSSFAATGLAESLDNRIHGRRDVVALLGVPRLATIPLMYLPEAGGSQRRLKGCLVAGLTSIGLVGLLLVHLAFMRLDVLWFVILRKLGG
ncbi:MAG: lipopolysaccharide biosynthesis protein [Gammaproteobacteria bacterium]|nr:lipopolysaccharide biosynthesis protein [Gammaproteobacteria bacterium]